MPKLLITTYTRCELQQLQRTYSDKYAAEEFLQHEENYILDSFQLLFEDVKKYFGKSLLMLDGYYLSEDNAIKSINNRLVDKCNEYKALSAKFNKEYSNILSKVKAEAKKEPNNIISISHELIQNNKRTGICILKNVRANPKPSLPADCHFVDLVKLRFIEKKQNLHIPEYLFSKEYKSLSFEEYTALIEALSVDEKKHKGLARTMELYHHLLTNAKNCFVYFIRPRITHSEYNGTLVLFLDRVLSETEFNLLSSFLNDILCETAIARLVYKTGLKVKSELSNQTGLIYWGDDTSTNDLVISVKTNLSISLRELINNKMANDEVNERAIKAKDEFIHYINSSFNTSNTRLNEASRVTNFFDKKIIKLNNSEPTFQEKFKQAMIVRRTVLLLTHLRNKNCILNVPPNSEQKKYLQYLPYFVLATFESKGFDNSISEINKKKRKVEHKKRNMATPIENNTEKEKYYGGKSFASIRQYLRYIGLAYEHRVSHTTPNVEIKFLFENNLPRIHQSEMDWLNTFSKP